ncbi:DUF6094 domain-containing protein [Alicyclobacillus sp. ALC3]|uniref:DUF6094 domain-containing protein n=1 Tax=Alicyclobacillus sp. ALC3 TaxID=2796143 RepID=UPI0023784F45|nr:DUF6094 domain-containing protein [Alicyclobacillus sp. ALC3]WDL99718.1 hypothetical protein JC200_24105 [Alicyclobacillus sp. ALC3]
MRYEGTAKMGYFPTPPTMTAKIKDRLVFEGPVRLFDPCCGEGDALAGISASVSDANKTYGIELDGYRADQATTKLHHVVNCGYEVARVEPASMQMLFLNPPYDSQSGLGGLENRKELRFLRDLAKPVAPGGVLVFVIPRYTLGPAMVNALLHRYTDVAVYRFDDKEYEAFRQVVVFGQRRLKNLTSSKEMPEADIQAKNGLLAYGKNEDLPMPTLDEPDGRIWTVPVAEDIEADTMFRGYILDDEELRQDLAHSEAFHIAESMLSVSDVQARLRRPLLPFRRTHIATLIAAGALNGAIGIGDNRHVVVGMTRKVINRETVTHENGSETVIDTESYVTAVRTIQPDGTILDLQ